MFIICKLNCSRVCEKKRFNRILSCCHFVAFTTTGYHRCYYSWVPQVLLQLGNTGVTAAGYHRCYYSRVPQVLLQLGTTGVTTAGYHRCYYSWVPQVLLQLGTTGVTTAGYHRCYSIYMYTGEYHILFSLYTKILYQQFSQTHTVQVYAQQLYTS